MGHSARTRTSPEGSWVFHMFVVGRATPHSKRAVLNLQRILDRHLPGGYDLEVFDLNEQPELAGREQLIVIPAVVRKSPEPPVKLTGDFSNEPRVVAAFGLEPPIRGAADRDG